MVSCGLAALGPALLAATLAGPARAAEVGTEVDLELVLAVDVSRSMTLDEQQLQRGGYVAAFRHPEVLEAIRSGYTGVIGVTYVEWSGPGLQTVIVPWTLVDGAEAAEGVARRLEGAPVSRWHGTSISGGLDFAVRLFDESPFAGMRQAIDVSGDGPNNMGLPVAAARDAAVARGITINGLPIVLGAATGWAYSYDITNLAGYYRDCVIGGPGAFTIIVDDPANFADAIRRKLILEIAAAAPPERARLWRVAEEGTDCMIGEKLRRRRGW